MVSLVTEPAKECSPGPHLKRQGNVRAWLSSLFRLPPTQTDTPGVLLWLETGRGFTVWREQAHCRDKWPSPRPHLVFLMTASLPLYSSICQPGRCLSICLCGFLITNQCAFTKGTQTTLRNVPDCVWNGEWVMATRTVRWDCCHLSTHRTRLWEVRLGPLWECREKTLDLESKSCRGEMELSWRHNKCALNECTKKHFKVLMTH